MAKSKLRVLPPNPYRANGGRAQNVAKAFTAYRKHIRTLGAKLKVDKADIVSDFLTDMRHWCDRNGVSFQVELKRANRHYQVETSTKRDL